MTQSGRQLAKSVDRLTELWGEPSNRRKDVGATVAILLISSATAAAGAVHTRIYGHDIFVVLDGAWRVLNGQRPAVDFSPGVGPLSAMIVAAGLKLAGNSVRGVGYASALVAVFTGLWAYFLSRKRMAWAPAMLASLVLALIAAAPYPLGLEPNQLSHAMLYNRYGYALLGVVMIESFQGMEGGGAAAWLFSGITSGVVSVLLLFLKPSFGLVALTFIGISALFGSRSTARLLGVFSGLVAAGVGWLVYMRFEVVPLWSELQLLAAARSSALSGWAVRWALIKGLPDFLWVALLALFVILVRSYRPNGLRLFEPLAVAILVFIGQALLLATNAQASGFPLNAALAIVLAEQGRVAVKESGAPCPTAILRADTIMLLIGLVCFLPTFAANASGITAALFQTTRNPPESEVLRFQQKHLASLFLYDVPLGTDSDHRSNGRAYVNYVNDGVELLSRHTRPEETVATLDLANPFSYALLRRPPHGGSSSMDYNYQFNDQHKPTPEWLFGSADAVMLPKHPAASQPTVEALRRNYLPALEAGFRLCAESDGWQLYKRPSNLNGCAAGR